jgi:hypothetical protein
MRIFRFSVYRRVTTTGTATTFFDTITSTVFGTPWGGASNRAMIA